MILGSIRGCDSRSVGVGDHMRVVFNSSIVEVNVSRACDVSAAAALIGFLLGLPGEEI